MFCSKCGREIESGAAFCKHCGARVEAASARPGVPQIQPAVPGRSPAAKGSGKGGGWKIACIVGAIVVVYAVIAVVAGRFIFSKLRTSGISLTKTEGNVHVRDKRGKDKSTDEGQKLHKGYQVDTGKESYVWLDLGSENTAKLDGKSQLEIRSQGKGQELYMDSGSLYFHIKEPLEEDEGLKLCTSDMTVEIREGSGWIEVPKEDHMRVCILEGKARCKIQKSDSKKEQKKSISAWETADLSVSGKDETKIETGSFAEADIPDFVKAEWEKDEKQKTKTSDKSEADSSAEGSSQESTKDIFQRVLSELISAKGVFHANQSGIMRSTSDPWFNPRGVISATISDFDQDGEEEMLVCHTEPLAGDPEGYGIMMSMYECREGEAVLADEIPLRAYQEGWDAPVRLVRNSWTDSRYEVSQVQANGHCYIMCEVSSVAAFFADGQSQDYWALVYENEKWNYACAFTQTAGGSAGFEHTGYEFENGTLVRSELYWAEDGAWNSSKPLYKDFTVAITEFFGKFGIQIRNDLSPYEHGERSLLAESNDKTDIFVFNNDVRSADGGYSTCQCNATLHVDAASTVSGEPAPSDDFSSGGADYLLPDVASRYLTADELGRLSKEELRLARNEVYARHGRMFKSADLQEYFNSKSWYRGQIPADQFNEAVLNQYERKNLDLIRKVEDSRP